MTRKDPATKAHAAFIAELRALHKRCGKPAYKRLSAISENLSEYYPLPQGEKYRFVPLSPAAISEILAGKRAQLPRFEWVASFVLCCQRCAYTAGAAADDPGRTSLPQWAKRLAAADRGEIPGAGPGDDHPAQAGPGGHGECKVRLTPGQQEFLASHGPYGHTLAEQAQAGNPDAVYRAALLLGTSPDHRDDAITLLVVAVATGHRPSASLLDDSPGQTPSFSPACFALARKAEAEGLYDQAQAFDQAAVRGRTAGVPTAPADRDTSQQENGSADPRH